MTGAYLLATTGVLEDAQYADEHIHHGAADNLADHERDAEPHEQHLAVLFGACGRYAAHAHEHGRRAEPAEDREGAAEPRALERRMRTHHAQEDQIGREGAGDAELANYLPLAHHKRPDRQEHGHREKYTTLSI